MKIMLLLSCAAAAALLLSLQHQPQAGPSGPQPPSPALQDAMSSHGIEVGIAGVDRATRLSVMDGTAGLSLQPVAYTQVGTR
ncbi:MAG TPA: hypothetical protein VNX47_00040 [Nevskia sp.]|nr:hypothetical protein [Nevskia sp.]